MFAATKKEKPIVLGKLLISTGCLLVEAVSAQSAVLSTLSSLDPLYDSNSRLSTHVLFYPAGKCADLIETDYANEDDVYTFGIEFRPVSGEAEKAFFPLIDPTSSKYAKPNRNPKSMDDCRAVCVERGVHKSLVTSVMPYRRYPNSGEQAELWSSGAGTFKDWFHETCRKVELAIVNYHSEDNPVFLYWINPQTGERKLDGTIHYGEQNTFAVVSYVGHQFVFVDSSTGKDLLDFTADFTEAVAIGESPPHRNRGNYKGKNVTKTIEYTLQQMWTLRKRVKRTFSPLGFRKGRLPPDLFASMGAFYYNNRNNEVREEWEGKSVFVNWWESDVMFVTIPWRLKQMWELRLLKLVEGWTGVKLEQSGMYGLRSYQEGARLLTHVDIRETHAASLIVNVAQGNLDEPWPVEVNDHADRVHQVTMDPGDVVYYESAKALHGRNTPLKGKGAYYVNLFTHYRPVGDDEWYDRPNPEGTPEPLMDVGKCKLKKGMTVNSIGVGAVKCTNAAIGPYLSPRIFEMKSGDDIVEWWRMTGPRKEQEADAEPELLDDRYTDSL